MQEQTKMELAKAKRSKAKPRAEKKVKNARSVKAGDIVRTKEYGEQVVRDVIVSVRLANGMDHVVTADEELEVLIYPEPEVEE